ncbi:MAG: outer membrane beta-barrel protein [Myxococcales bacterium]|nr:outer membrane beta-barrel protein [Myxococcales bacterium]
MRKFLSLAVMCSLAFPAMAFAQPEAPKVAEDADMGMPESGEMTPTGVESGEPPPTEAIMAIPESSETAADDMAVEADEAASWKDGISWMVMASAFYRVGGYTGSGVLPGPYNNLLTDTGRLGYPYTGYNGFGLNFVGGDFQYTGEKFAVRLDLRWGNGAPLLSPLHPVKQGYVSWMPNDKLSFDFGFFDTIFGAEVADEWNNANYTRGALYFLRQPFNHLGIRMGVELSDSVGFTMMVTNGGVFGGGGSLLVADPDVSGIDNNATPTIGWQFSFAPNDDVGLYIGGNHGAGGDLDNRNWDNFFDWVLSVGGGPVTLLLNGDYTTLPSFGAGDGGLQFLYGHSAALIFDVTDKFSIGLRGEHLSGNEQQRNLSSAFGYLATGTITLRYKPVEYLVLSLEGRGEWTSRDVYLERNGPIDADGNLLPSQSKNYAAILGFTAYIGN